MSVSVRLRALAGLIALVGASLVMVAPAAQAVTEHCDDHATEVKVQAEESPKTVMVYDTTTDSLIEVVVTISGTGFTIEPTDPSVVLTNADWCVKSSTKTNDGTGTSGQSESYNKRGVRQAISYVVVYSVTTEPYQPPVQECDEETQSGGAGVTSTNHDLGIAGPTEFLFEWEAINIPDRFQVFYEGSEIYDTGFVGDQTGEGTGSDTVSVPVGTSTQITVVVTGSDPSTAWNYRVNCPGPRES